MKRNDRGVVQKTAWRQNAALFIVSQAVTLFGSSIVQMAIIWQVALETSSGLWVTLLTLCSTIPQTVVSLFAGVLADRYSRKRLIVFSDVGVASVTLLLALILLNGTAENTLPLILLVSALRSLGAGVQTPAVNAVIPQIVPEEHLIRYNGVSGSMMSIVQFAAPAAAGALLSLVTFSSVLLMDVATAVVGIVILAFVKVGRVPDLMPPQKGSFFREMRSGISFALRDKLVGGSLLTFGAFIFLCVPSGFLAVLMIERTFGESYMFLTVSEMVGFAGMVLGGLLLGLWGGFKERRKTLALGLFSYSIFSIVLSLTDTFWLFACMMFLTSFAIPIVQSSITTVLQESVPKEKQGRVFGLMGAMYSGFMPIGMALFGPLADVVRIQSMVLVCGVAITLLGVSVITKRISR